MTITSPAAVITDDDIRALPPMVKFVQASRVLGMGRSKAFDLLKAGEYPVRVERVGDRLYVPRADLMAFLGLPTAPPQISSLTA
mgnify:CR=1 FL=1